MAGVYRYRRSLGLRGIIVEVESQGSTLSVIGENVESSGKVEAIEGQWAGPPEPRA